MDGRDKVIEELRALTAKQAAQLAKHAEQIEKLTARIGELELQLVKAKKDSTTSSKPPSSYIAKPKPKQLPGRPKKPRQGGQVGHERHLREPLPPERVNETIPTQQQLGSDETSIKDNGKKHCTWCITAAIFTVFHIARTRSRGVLEKLVGKEFEGYLNFDYFSANCSFAWNYWIM